MIPIWKPIELDMTSHLVSGVVDYSVSVGGTIIYHGRAYADAAGNCKVRLNDIFKDYFSQNTADIITGSGIEDAHAVEDFSVMVGSTSYDYEVVNDWSYEARSYSGSGELCQNAPIIPWKLAGGFTPQVYLDISALKYSYMSPSGLEYDSGETYETAGAPWPKSVLFAFDNEFGAGRLTIWTRRRGASGWTNGQSFEVRERCSWLSLMYRNKYGGYDVLAMDSVVTNDGYARGEYTADVRKNWMNAQTRSITLRTPPLDDLGADRIDNLIGSTDVLFYNGGQPVPVVLRTDSVKHKTFKNEGRKRVVYEIVCDYAQPMERR